MPIVRETGYPATGADSGFDDGEVSFTMAADRSRESPRVESVFRVRYTTLDQLVVAYSADLSKGGMFLASDQLLPVNSTLRLLLELPGEGGELCISCRVVYLRDKITADRTGKTAGMGIQFLDLAEEALTQVGRLIAEQSIESSGPRSTRKALSVLVVDDDYAAR